MKWSRAKTIFIYIFIFVNIFLFTVYRMNSSEGKQINIQNVVAVLEGYDISVKPELFVSLPQRIKQVEAINISEDEELLKALMGKEYTEENGIIASGSKRLDISSSSAVYTNSAPEDRRFSGINRHNASGRVTDFLSKAGIGKKYISPERVTSSEDNKFGITIGYEYDGNKIFTNRLLVTANEKGIEKITGPFLSFAEIENRYYNTISSENAFMDYLSFYGQGYTEKTEILEISCGYYISLEQGSVSSYAIPAYEFVFSNNKTIYLDAREDIEPEFKLLSEK